MQKDIPELPDLQPLSTATERLLTGVFDAHRVEMMDCDAWGCAHSPAVIEAAMRWNVSPEKVVTIGGGRRRYGYEDGLFG